MVDLALAVACSLAIGVIFKIASQRGLDRVALLTANYAVAVVVGAGLVWAERDAATVAGWGDAGLWLLGGVTGGLFIYTFFLFALSTAAAGLSLAIGVMRIAVVVPVLASWLIWQEVPSSGQGVGLLLGGAAFFLIAARSSDATDTAGVASAKGVGVLALLFLCNGAVDVCLKTFDEVFAGAHSRAQFLLLVYGVALVLGLGVVLYTAWRTGRKPSARVLGWGVVLGVVNYGSSAFFLRAVEQLEGPFVFPVNSIALVLGGAVLGVVLWQEPLSRRNIAGLALAAVALFFLSR